MSVTFNPFTGNLDFAGGAGGGTTTPAAPDTSVQFNDGGVFGGDAALTWDKTAKSLAISDGVATTLAITPYDQGFRFDGGTIPGSNVGNFIFEADGDPEVNYWLLSTHAGGAAQVSLELGFQEFPNAGIALYAGQSGDVGQIQSKNVGPFLVDVVNANANGYIQLRVIDTNGGTTKSWFLRNSGDLEVPNGGAIQTDQTTGHTAVLQAYDVDGAAYKTFVTLLNGNTPRFTIEQPAGGSLVILPPTSDPHVAGALWNNSGLAVISSG